jgi:hypothetical protein
MSADTPSLPGDETRVHPTEPAEGQDENETSATEEADVRQHATEPAEGEDLP